MDVFAKVTEVTEVAILLKFPVTMSVTESPFYNFKKSMSKAWEC